MDIAGFVGRARRLGDLSQRDLAERAGVSQSSVARVEAGSSEPTVAAFAELLRHGGLRLVVVDAEGHPVEPLPADAIRDNGDRKFPAHLDVSPPDRMPSNRIDDVKRGRDPARGWYQLRDQRDEARRREGRVDDHPTTSELAARRREWLLGKRSPSLRPARPEDDCSCETECWIGTICVAACACQCEPGVSAS